VHDVTISSNTYHYTQLGGDSSTAGAAGVAAAVNAGAGDANATASNSGSTLILTAKKNDNTTVSCSTTEAVGQTGSITRSGNTVTFGFFNYFGTGYSHFITIAGKLGSGKSSTANKVASVLGYTRASTGDFMRKMAEEKGMTLQELSTSAESDPSFDIKLDDYNKEIGKKRMFHFWFFRELVL